MVEAKFYCTSCRKVWPESKVTTPVGNLIHGENRLCPDCGGEVEYAAWRVMVEEYSELSGFPLEKAEHELKARLEDGVGHGVGELYDLAQCLEAALNEVYGNKNPPIRIEPYVSSADDCSDDDLDAEVEFEKGGRRFTVRLTSFGGCPFCQDYNFEDAIKELDEFLRESLGSILLPPLKPLYCNL